MKTKYTLIFFCFLFALTTSVQAQKEVYHEDFSSKNNGWPVGENDRRVLEIKNGKYYFEHKPDSGSWNVTTVDLDINQREDFEFETSVQRISGKKNNAVGLMYGAKDGNNTFHFVLSTGQYRVSKKVDGEFIKIKDWTVSSSIKQEYYDYNKLKVTKRGNKLYFYINNDLVTTQTHQAFFGNKIGILVYNDQKIALDYIKATQSTGSPIVNKNNNSLKTIFEDDFSSNANDWGIQDDENATVQIRNNNYYFEHKKTTLGWNSTKSIEIDTNKDFEIETRIQKISGVQDNGYGVVFGKKDNDNQFVFTLSANGYYSIDQYENGTFKALKKWTKSSHIKTGNYVYNTLKIKKEGKSNRTKKSNFW